MTRYTFNAVLGIATFGLLSACAPVQIIEDHDPRIEQGMTEYQRALEVFVGRTLANYESCALLRDRLEPVEEMQCRDGSPEVIAMCEESIARERAELAADVDEACDAASFESVRRSFYIQQEARLSVLKTRAAVLDSMGVCVGALQAVSRAVDGVLPSQLRGAISVDGESRSNNCTEIVVNTVLENHREMASTHRCIDDPTLADCPDQFAAVDPDDWNGALQASFFFPTMLETLQQNIRIVLFLEEAKKRGDSSDGG